MLSPQIRIHNERGDIHSDEASSANRMFSLSRSRLTSSDIEEKQKINIRKTKRRDPIQDGIMGYMDRELKKEKIASPFNMYGTNSPPMHHKSSRKKSKRRDHRRHGAVDDLEVHNANANILKYINLNTEDGSQLTGNIEPMVNNKYNTTRTKDLLVGTHNRTKFRTNHKKPFSDVTVALQDLSDDVVLANEEIYNPFTPVVSPTEGCPAPGLEKIYVQTDRGFRAVSKDKACGRHVVLSGGRMAAGADAEGPVCRPYEGHEPLEQPNIYRTSTPLGIAQTAQLIWTHVATACHGLLAGISLMHIILLASVEYATMEFMQQYKLITYGYLSSFYFLAALCFVSVCDRFDVHHLNFNHLTDFYHYKKTMIAVPIYLIVLILTLMCNPLDDRLYLLNYSEVNVTQLDITEDSMSRWAQYSYCRAAAAIAGWVVIAIFDNGDDMLYTHLINMNKYQEVLE